MIVRHEVMVIMDQVEYLDVPFKAENLTFILGPSEICGPTCSQVFTMGISIGIENLNFINLTHNLACPQSCG